MSQTLYFRKSHEWMIFSPELKTVRIGISDHGQRKIGEILHVEPPSEGKYVSAEDSLAVLESSMTAADIYAPVDGKVTKINEEVIADPKLINDDPFGSWIVQMTYDHVPPGLMNEEEYQNYIN